MSQILVDVSEHNGDIDWELVKATGYHAIIRVGFGRFDAGGRLDYKFERNVSECERLGIPYGVYWYSYAASPESAAIEGQQMVSAIAGHNPAYPVYFDTEEPGTQSVSRANAEAFGDVVEAAGYWCGVYASQSWWDSNLSGLERFTKWVAKWSDSAPTVGDTDLWQNRGADADSVSLRANVPGIGWSDLNVLLRDTMLDEIGRWNQAESPAEDEVKRCPTCGQPLPETPSEPVEEPKDVPADDMPAQEPTVTGKLTYPQMAAEVMYHMCTHDGNGGHGYSQYRRWGDGTFENVTLSDGTVVTIANGDYDCSSAVITAWEAVLPGSTADATYTGNMREEFLSTGLFAWHPMGDGYIAQVGDIYLNEIHHTAMCWSAEPDIMMQFSLSENNSIDGQQGDQTGWESNVKEYQNYWAGWDGKLVYVGPARDGSGDATNQAPADNATSTQSVDVDGYWGRGTTAALQAYFGTEVDGEVWHQWAPNVARNGALTTGWMCDESTKGSPLIRAMQAWLGITTDGILGTEFVTALQRHFGTTVDGVLDPGSTCVKAMQRALNNGSL